MTVGFIDPGNWAANVAAGLAKLGIYMIQFALCIVALITLNLVN